jgi:hypothetical protein
LPRTVEARALQPAALAIAGGEFSGKHAIGTLLLATLAVRGVLAACSWPAAWAAASFSNINRQSSLESAPTGGRKLGLHEIQRRHILGASPLPARSTRKDAVHEILNCRFGIDVFDGRTGTLAVRAVRNRWPLKHRGVAICR